HLVPDVLQAVGHHLPEAIACCLALLLGRLLRAIGANEALADGGGDGHRPIIDHRRLVMLEILLRSRPLPNPARAVCSWLAPTKLACAAAQANRVSAGELTCS